MFPGFVRIRPVALAAGLLAAACSGRPDAEAGRLPPPPPEVPVTMPAFEAAGVFWLQGRDVGFGGGSDDLRLVLGAADWAWAGRPDPEAPAAFLQTASQGELPTARGTETVSLPDARISWAGQPMVVVRRRFPEVMESLAGAPVAVPLLLANAPAPESELERHIQALGAAFLQAAAAGLPRFLGHVEGAVEFGEGPGLVELRGVADPPLPEVAWSEAWFPPSPPASVAMLRLELPKALVWSRYAEQLDRWDTPPPPEPRTDLTVELHVLNVEGKPGILLTYPFEWVPVVPELDWESLARRVREPFSFFDAPGGESELPLEGLFVRQGDAAQLMLGLPGFSDALARALQRDRPMPYAERRYRWPRGSLGVIVDWRSLQDLMRATLPVPVPNLGGDVSSAQRFELVVAADDGDLRLRFTWPEPPDRIGGLNLGGLSNMISEEALIAPLFELLGEDWQRYEPPQPLFLARERAEEAGAGDPAQED